MKKSLLLFAFIFITAIGVCQLRSTRSQIISSKGTNYTAGTLDGKYQYITYLKNDYTQESGSSVRATTYFFDSEQMCVLLKIVEPTTEANQWVNYMNLKMVKLGELYWKDYETNTYIKIQVDEKFFTITYSIATL